MYIKDISDKLPPELIESAYIRNIKEFTPPQEQAIKKGLLNGTDLVIASPTASGKTFIAEIAMIKNVLWDRKKAIYIAPMRALVSEKFNEFKAAYPYLKIAVSMGDLDSMDEWLENFDIIFISTEKLDSLIRHGLNWLDRIGTIIIDELHMLGESGRGPTLEILITRLKRECKEAQKIYLSATIGNAEEMSLWLGAELVFSEYRPVPLQKGIVVEDKVHYGEEIELLKGNNKISEFRVVEDTLNNKKQILIFYSSKRNAEAGSEKLSKVIKTILTEEEKQHLEELSEKILLVLSKPTPQCEKLSKVVKSGVAFHHSGLLNSQRSIIEDAFREGYIKVICSTTTLGIGVNLPANTVLIRDIYRYSQEGSSRININEVTQLLGRAGRPKYDKYGRGLIIGKSDSDAKDLFNYYIKGELEPINSNLGYMPSLRSHILSFIATNFLTMEDSILSFLSGTFYNFTGAGLSSLKTIVRDVLDQLEKWEFIEKFNTKYLPTKLGKRISELYIDPVSARWIITSLSEISDEISMLFMICNTSEMRPYAKVTEEAEDLLSKYAGMLDQYEPSSGEFYDIYRPFSTALMLNDWINEVGETDIMLKYKESPGSLYSKTTNADWLLYSGIELSKILHKGPAKLIELRVRVKYGIKKELLDLTRLEQVGRVRARLLFNSGIKTVSDLRNEKSKEKVERLFGKEIAKKILDQTII
ncbi:MAG: DEAD/DEAH box helicase [Candidatus Micrarchaeaceae archaeon]